jgi:hypothetical protein
MSARSDTGRGSEAALWFAAVGGAAAWALHLAVGWFLEEVVACGTATTDRGAILGLDVELWILGITAVLGMVAVAAGVVGYRRWRRPPADGTRPRAGREAFMAFAGLLGAGLFLPIILMGGLQVLTLHPCSP